MKIGIITFHWATNYGAVLQAFALQEYLKEKGHVVEIIDYKPSRVVYLRFIGNIRRLSFVEIVREFKINRFRKQYLNLSAERFKNSAALIKAGNDYDVFICGSDQIWNESFTLCAEGGPTLSYFIDFVKDDKPRIAYAASFGTDKLSPKVVELITPELRKFKSISVRENTGVEILRKINIESTLVLDPTLLLDSEVFKVLIAGVKTEKEYKLFSHIININQLTAENIRSFICENYFKQEKNNQYAGEPIEVLEWLLCIREAQLVITNSYHGVIFSIIYHTPFIVVPVEGSNMNNRIATLLCGLGLENRIVDCVDKMKINLLREEQIKWSNVEAKLKVLRENSEKFLKNSMNGL